MRRLQNHCFRHPQNNEQHLKSQRMMLSPRALEQGWKEEFDSNIAQHREWITKRKLEAVFEKALPARKLEEEVIMTTLYHTRSSISIYNICCSNTGHAIRFVPWVPTVRDLEMQRRKNREAGGGGSKSCEPQCRRCFCSRIVSQTLRLHHTTEWVIAQSEETCVSRNDRSKASDTLAFVLCDTCSKVKQRDEELANRNHRAMQLAHWRDEELREIFYREARRRFDGQHLVERRKVGMR